MRHRNFTILSEKRPDRCDVCHQSDLFNPETGICERCKFVPVEQLANPQINVVQTIPPSVAASALAAAVSCFCFSASLVILNGSLGSVAGSARMEFFHGLLLLSSFNLLISIAVNRWCSDNYSDRLDYRIVPIGMLCSSIGLIASAAGIIGSLYRVWNA